MFNIPSTETLLQVYEIIITVSGILFGLLYTALIFILQSSFDRLKVMRQTLLDIYLKYGTFVLTALSYTTLVPLLIISNQEQLALYLFLIYSPLLIVFAIRYLLVTGYVNTIFTTKFIPPNANFLIKFITKIFNNNPILIVKYLLIFIIIVYPFFIGWENITSLQYATDYMFISIISILIFAILTVPYIINEAFAIQKHFLESEYTRSDIMEDSQKEWDEVKLSKETNFLLKQIEAFDLYSSPTTKKDESDYFEYFVTPSPNTGKIHFNIILSNLKFDDKDQFINRIKVFSVQFLQKLAICKTDFNTFALSFHFSFSGVRKNIFIITDKAEIMEKIRLNEIDFFNSLKNKAIDEVFG